MLFVVDKGEFFFKKIYLFDSPIVTMGREIWILEVSFKNTKKCQSNYNTFGNIGENLRYSKHNKIY